jgi:2'-5' RNA ligase
MVRAGQRVLAAPFDLLLDRLSIGGRSAALRPGYKVPELYLLQEQISEAMAVEGVGMRDDWRFSPHVTLTYRERAPATQPVADRGWRADEFVLIHSLVGQTRHELLGRWRLDCPPDPQLALFPV